MNKYLTEFELSKNQLEKFSVYYNLLIDGNNKINLTSITDEKEVYIKHYYDSLLLTKVLKDAVTIADIGSGAGFPGIPLKIAQADLAITLIEPIAKRARFLEEVVVALELEKIVVLNERAELLLEKREYYDAVTSRAVAPLNILLEVSIPLLKVKGKMYALKGSSYLEEIENARTALQKLDCEIINIYNFMLPEKLGQRVIIEIQKNKKTREQYPRTFAKIKKSPL